MEHADTEAVRVLPARPLWGDPEGWVGENTPAVVPVLPAEGPQDVRGLVLVLPGGAYHHRAAHEGEPVARWFAQRGVAAAVVNYRVNPYRHPVPMQDALRAIRVVRYESANWALPTHAPVAVLGFSAGGHLAACTAVFGEAGEANASDPVERESGRPDAAVLCYPVISTGPSCIHAGCFQNLLGERPDPALLGWLSAEQHVQAHTPPAFLWHTADDAAVPVSNALYFADAMARHGRPFEMHVFPHGRHGLGLAEGDPVIGQWPTLALAWLRNLGF